LLQLPSYLLRFEILHDILRSKEVSVMAVTSRVTKSGQTTIPAEIRKRIGLKPGGTVIWGVNERGRAEVQAVEYTVDDLCGILPPLPGMETSEDMERAIKEAFEASVAEKIREFTGE
jgi:AbrB family looped-hinge helix DNA binding protein